MVGGDRWKKSGDGGKNWPPQVGVWDRTELQTSPLYLAQFDVPDAPHQNCPRRSPQTGLLSLRWIIPVRSLWKRYAKWNGIKSINNLLNKLKHTVNYGTPPPNTIPRPWGHSINLVLILLAYLCHFLTHSPGLPSSTLVSHFVRLR